MHRILIACMGNLLRRDDGFGVEVARRLAKGSRLPPEVTVVELGIGGIHLVQELMNGYQVLVVVDAMERRGPPGTLHLLEAEVPDLSSWPAEERSDFLADMHYTTPSRALILSKALGVLPPKVLLLGCQPGDISDLGLGLTEPVREAADAAIMTINGILRSVLRVDEEAEVKHGGNRDSHNPGFQVWRMGG